MSSSASFASSFAVVDFSLEIGAAFLQGLGFFDAAIVMPSHGHTLSGPLCFIEVIAVSWTDLASEAVVIFMFYTHTIYAHVP